MPTQTGSYDLKAAKSSTDVADAAQYTADNAINNVNDLGFNVNSWINGGYSASTDEKDVYYLTSDTVVNLEKVYFERTGSGTADTYTVSSDTSVDSEKTYYERSGSGTVLDPYVYVAIDDPDQSANPHTEGWYEFVPGDPYVYSVISNPDTSVNPHTAGWYEKQVTIDADVSSEKFYEAVDGVFGDYSFVYNGSAWVLGSTVVDLSDYGITLPTGFVPTTNDTFTIVLKDISGVVKDLETNYDDLSKQMVNILPTANAYTDGQSESLQQDIQNNADVISDIVNDIDGIENITSKMKYDDTNGLVLYSLDPTTSSQQQFILQLSPTRINFIEGSLGNASNVAAYISNRMLSISNARITDKLQFGDFAFITRSNGNMSLKYLGTQE